MVRPRPQFPYYIYAPDFPEADRLVIEAAYRKFDAEWQREASRELWLSGVPVIGAAVAIIVAAIFGPGLALETIKILAR